MFSPDLLNKLDQMSKRLIFEGTVDIRTLWNRTTILLYGMFFHADRNCTFSINYIHFFLSIIFSLKLSEGKGYEYDFYVRAGHPYIVKMFCSVVVACERNGCEMLKRLTEIKYFLSSIPIKPSECR